MSNNWLCVTVRSWHSVVYTVHQDLGHGKIDQDGYV